MLPTTTVCGVKPTIRCAKAELAAYVEAAREEMARHGRVMLCDTRDCPNEAAPRSCYCRECEQAIYAE